MTVVVGGLRARLIKDSLFYMIKDSLTDLGWFDVNRRHKPVQMQAEPVPNDIEIPLNTLAISPTDEDSLEDEMGSNLEENRWTYYVDLYAEDESLGTHLIHDIKDIVRGKIPSIGRIRPLLEVKDYAEDNPNTTLFTCQIEDVLVDRAHDFPKAWQRYWFVLRFTIVDHYGDENDDEVDLGGYGGGYEEGY